MPKKQRAIAGLGLGRVAATLDNDEHKRFVRGKKERGMWYMLHWILGTIISLVGIINVYTGLNAYNRKTSRSTTLWTILFAAEVSFIAFFYLFQDKWEYMQKQGVTLGDLSITLSNQEIPERFNQKEMLPEPCGKRNALMNCLTNKGFFILSFFAIIFLLG
ncbi:cytochrome b561 domain-containing protein [Quercus suber]|uniref:Cytochrome b561 domain-containing protein n=1 Tax=Quercus suber TaxID=58331 RepID=A0AAW0LE49_QUESU|nr:cytochrome b561 domain-containing protein At4g18260-like [Quercus suber]